MCDSPDVRVVLVTAEGPRFCVGGDLKSFAAYPDLGRGLGEVTADLHEAVARLVELDMPVVVAVQGVAAGAGLGLVCAADIAIASASATFLMAYTGVGLTPDASTSWFLPRLLGPRRAIDVTLMNKATTASQAFEWGLVSELVPEDDPRPRAEAVARHLAEGPTLAFGAAKRLLRAGGPSLREHLAAEREHLMASGHTSDGREGVQAFVERRAPRYRGC
jgi:2-(1,2-epoxy-1,2-dihydrophenyl)acetyl-CoA isomerase